MIQRDNLPVCLIYTVQGVLSVALGRVGSYLFADVGHVVERLDGTTHEDGLRQHDCPGKDVARVGTESVDYPLAALVQFACCSGHVGSQRLLQVGRQQPHVGA